MPVDVTSAMSEEKFQIYLWDSAHALKRVPKYYLTEWVSTHMGLCRGGGGRTSHNQVQRLRWKK